MKSSVIFPRSSARTTPLGVGLATLMREPSSSRRLRLLHHAYEVGYRHFDVAPSYGLGAAEATLARFLSTRPSDVTVATKVGIRARAGVLTRVVQRPARALLRRFPALRGQATAAVGGVVHTRPDFTPESCTRSLENSLRVLGIPAIDLLLLHEAQVSDLQDGRVLDWLDRQRDRGLVRHVGIATSAEHASCILGIHGSRLDALQVPSNVLAPALAVFADGHLLPLTHGAVAAPLTAIERRRQSDPKWAADLLAHAPTDLKQPGELGRLLVACALADNRRGIVLVGSSTADHLNDAVAAVDAYPTFGIAVLQRFLRATLGNDPSLSPR